MNSVYSVKTDVFEGPLDVLLDLVEKRKLFVNDISLAAVADDYVAYLRTFEKMPVDFVSNFLIVASTLILIKSKSLLPSLNLTEEENQDIHELERRLSELQRIREKSLEVKRLFGHSVVFSKSHARLREVVFVPTAEISIPSVVNAMQNIIARFPKKSILPKVVVKKVISLEEMMDRLTTRITGSFKMSFHEFAGVGKEEKVNIIVGFLAMLELVKQGIIAVTQNACGGDIEMETNVLDTPQYGK